MKRDRASVWRSRRRCHSPRGALLPRASLQSLIPTTEARWPSSQGAPDYSSQRTASRSVAAGSALTQETMQNPWVVRRRWRPSPGTMRRTSRAGCRRGSPYNSNSASNMRSSCGVQCPSKRRGCLLSPAYGFFWERKCPLAVFRNPGERRQILPGLAGLSPWSADNWPPARISARASCSGSAAAQTISRATK